MKEIQIGNRTITVQREWITGFLATWILGLLAHAYRFFNFLPTWDSMFNFKGTGATFYSGYVPGKKPSGMHSGGGTDRVVSDHNIYLCIHVYRRWVHGSISVICTWSVSDL